MKERTYEPKVSEIGQPIETANPKTLFPGVFGYAIEHKGLIYIPLIEAENRGAGAVGTFLDSISCRCRIVNVCSPILRDMLVKRKFKCSIEETEMGPADIWAPPKGGDA